MLAAFLSVPAFSQTVAVSLNSAGLTSLRSGGVEYLGYGDFRLNAIQMRNPSGQVITGSVSAATSLDLGRQELTRQYPWGTVKVGYVTSGNRLSLSITTTNSSPNTITGLFYEPFAIRFPSKPAQYDGNTPILGHNIGNPTVLTMTYGQSALTLANDDVNLPLLVGFPFAADRPGSMLLYPLRVNTGVEPTYPDSLPRIDRPIGPGASDTYRISLRFGPAVESPQAAASDVFAQFVARYPRRFNWPDRRAIGSMIIATSAAGWRTNPRGWLLDPSIDITTPTGVAAFRTRLLAWADGAVAILLKMNAQGMITWDIEGEQYPHAITYIGDPRIFATLAPEMSGVADEYFKKFRDAGLRVGVCIRPQQFAVSGSSAVQNEVNDPAALLIDKITYAKNRWGATLFYIDSNGDPNFPTPVEAMARVAAAHPDVLLIPEHQNLAYFSLSAPYDELRGGVSSTPGLARSVYPSAFSAINTADGPIDQRYGELRTAVSLGDILMFRGWFDDPGNAKVKSLYPFQPDASPPAVSLLAPGNYQAVSAAIRLLASATDNVGVVGVRFFIDGQPFGVELTQAPYVVSLDTRTLSNGVHSISVVARDGAGLTASASAQILVSNSVADLTPPRVSFLTPGNGSVVNGTVAVSAFASDNAGTPSVQFTLNGAPLGARLFNAPWSVQWDTSKQNNGTHVLVAQAQDSAGNVATSSITVQVNNLLPDTTNPTIRFESPANGSTLTGTATIVASASDNVKVAAVRFLLNGQQIGNLLVNPPYSIALNTAVLSSGTYVLTAIALDTAGNTAQTSITVVVAAIAPPTPPVTDTQPPVVGILFPQNNSTISDLIALSATATDNVGVASVRYLMDGILVGVATTPPYAVNLDSRVFMGGTHYLSVEALDAAGNNGKAALSLTVANSLAPGCNAIGIGTFVGCYHAGELLSDPRRVRIDREINFDWAASAPDPSVPADSFSASWTGRFNFDGGNYFFESWIDDGARLLVDGVTVLDAWTATGLKNHTLNVPLTPGTHTIRLEYREGFAGAAAKLVWSRR